LADTATQETLRARTWAATEKADATANAWLSYSFVESNTKISIQATRYWTGTKQFYVRIKNAHGLPSWFKFYAKVEGGELKKDATPSGDFKFGKSTTQVPTEATNAGAIFNPIATNHYTLWLKQPISSQGEVTLNVDDLFPSTYDTDDVAFFQNVTYGANRYDATATSAPTAEPITNADPGETPSSKYFTNVTWDSPVETFQFNSTNGAFVKTNVGNKEISFKAKTERPAGNYYYTMTLKVMLYSKVCSYKLEELDLDIIYKIDNTRPDLLTAEKLVTLSADPTSTSHEVSLLLSDFISDPDNNTLKIKDIIVPQYEYVAVDQYGYLKQTPAKGASNYNKGITVGGNALANADIVAHSTILTGSDYGNVIKTAQNQQTATGFHSYAYGGSKANKLVYHDPSDGFGTTSLDSVSDPTLIGEAYVHVKITNDTTLT
ncbi:MAG: hypothetical protein K2M95_07915, partial [Clostridiales bacterium]|nr:hypothetical protein [Clostridiales bacterium]